MNYKIRTESIDPSRIIIPKDYKPDSEALAGLVSSIKEVGLQNNPAIKENGEIIAGKLRVLACVGILDQIDVSIYPSDLDPKEYEIISIHENLKRYNLPWYEEVIQEAKLHELRQSEHGEGKTGKKVGWSIRDTAAELNISFGYLSEDIRMAQAVLADPNLRKITDKTTARRVILRTIKRINQEQGLGAPLTFKANQCICGSSEVVLQAYDNCTFDACITDPPWLEYKDSSLIRDEFTLSVFRQIYRTLKSNAFLYMFVGTQDWIYYELELTKIGFHVQKWPLIWVKEGSLSYGNRSWEYQRDYEPILLAVKGSPAVTTNMISSVMSCKVVPSAKMIHPNEKPPEVIKRLIDHCSYEDSIIVDPFAGSFVVPDTCKLMNRKYIAIEKNKQYFTKGEARLK